jgi:F-type H+-transporting ATPase subunit b
MEALIGSTTFWYFLSFVCFVVLAFQLGRKAVLAQLDARIEEIKKKIDTAESLRVEAQEMLAQYQRKQRDAFQESEQIIENAKANAERIRSKSAKEIEKAMAKREQALYTRIEQMQENAMIEIHKKAADLAVNTARIILREKLEENPDKALIEESIEKISSGSRE